MAIEKKPLEQSKWKRIQNECDGKIGSIIELLQGKLSSAVMAVVTAQREGLFPLPREIRLACSCPDSAVMCKHVAAALYGVGNRLDAAPRLLFLMRGVDPQELIAGGVSLPGASGGADNLLADDSLADIFRIDLDLGETPPA